MIISECFADSCFSFFDFLFESFFVLLFSVFESIFVDSFASLCEDLSSLLVRDSFVADEFEAVDISLVVD